jgi:ubiquinone/menaquinone biosynthesis C-methylase UbiE
MNLDEYERMFRFEDTYWWFVARRHLIATLLGDFSGSNRNLSLLDIGCGTGAMLDELEPFGTVIGADFCEEALGFCKRRGANLGNSYRLCRADARHLPFPPDTFDAVTAMDIIEHIREDDQAITEIARVLKPGGRLFATVPAFMSLWSGHDEALHHFRRYTVPHFRKLATDNGLIIDRISYTVTALFPLIWFFRAISRKIEAAQRAPNPHANLMPFSKPVNSALLAISKVETQMIRHSNLPFGVTVVAVAHKGA